MTIELAALAGVGAILFATILAQSLHTDLTAGLAYAFSSRDTPAPARGRLGERLDRIVRNQIEGLALFLPLVVASAAAGIGNGWTEGAALAYLAARALHPIAYALGLNPWRSLVWTAGFAALPAYAFGLWLGAGG